MFLLKELLIFYSVLLTSTLAHPVVKSQKDIKSFSNALDAILKDQFIEKSAEWTFDFIIIGKKHEHFVSNFFTNMMKLNSKGNFKKIKIHLFDNIYKVNISLANSAIFFLESSKDIKMMNNRVKMTNVDYLNFKHLVISLKSEKYSEFNKNLVQTSKAHELQNFEIFLFKEKEINNFVLATQNLYSSKQCATEMKIINIFSVKNQNWINNNFGLIETKQFNGCKIGFPPLETAMGKSLRDLYEILGIKKLNLTITNDVENYPPFIVIDGEYIDVYTNSNDTNWFVYKFFDNELTYIAYVGDPISSYEKFITPFDAETWICCGLFFGCSFLIIFIINLMKNRQIQQFIYGTQVQYPAFNILVAFFGQSQNVLPSRSFARFLLMIFILFCLVTRTAYQGVQFDMIYMVRKLMNLIYSINHF